MLTAAVAGPGEPSIDHSLPLYPCRNTFANAPCSTLQSYHEQPAPSRLHRWRRWTATLLPKRTQKSGHAGVFCRGGVPLRPHGMTIMSKSDALASSKDRSGKSFPCPTFNNGWGVPASQPAIDGNPRMGQDVHDRDGFGLLKSSRATRPTACVNTPSIDHIRHRIAQIRRSTRFRLMISTYNFAPIATPCQCAKS